MPDIDFTNTMCNKSDYLSFSEIDKMLQYCYDIGKYRDYMLILTLFRTGRRITEIVGERPFLTKVGLRPIDIHPNGLVEFDILKKKHIKSKTKAGKQRNEDQLIKERLLKMPKRVLLPVDKEYMGLLKDYITKYNIGLYDRIFAINRIRAWVIVSQTAKACNIHRPNGKIHPHSLRHSFAIHLIKSNPNNAAVIRQVQDLLQHSDIKMTMENYGRFTQEDKKETLNDTFIQERKE